jgi:signal transduction histidine kinase
VATRLSRDRRAADAPPRPGALEKIQASWRRLSQMVEGLLEHSRLRSGRLALTPETFAAPELAREVVAELEPQAAQKGLALELVAQDGVTFTSDPRIIRIVLANLVANAVKFTERGRVEVAVRRGTGTLELSVSDTGPGIPEADRGRIFEPFEQVEDSRRKHLPGVGLGLALVKQLTEALGGTVELSSQVGVGSRFTVKLPELAPIAASP